LKLITVLFYRQILEPERNSSLIAPHPDAVREELYIVELKY
jgi:hypothetical protein